MRPSVEMIVETPLYMDSIFGRNVFNYAARSARELIQYKNNVLRPPSSVLHKVLGDWKVQDFCNISKNVFQSCYS